MKDIKEIVEALKNAGEGAIVEIKGYVDSKGRKSDTKVELLGPGGYKEMRKGDLAILNSTKVQGIDQDEVSLEALQTAHKALVASCLKSLDADKEVSYGPAYVTVANSLSQLSGGDEGAYYLMKLRLLSEPREEEPRKSESARSKQICTEALKLPSRLYVHALKIAEGKFDEIFVRESPKPQVT